MIITADNIVPLITAVTALVAAVGAIINGNRNHAETLNNIQRLDDHNNTIGAATVSALADSVPITQVPALVAAAATPSADSAPP